MIEYLREAQYAQEEDFIGSIHPLDKENTFIVDPLTEKDA
jgi:hypothetical protein